MLPYDPPRRSRPSGARAPRTLTLALTATLTAATLTGADALDIILVTNNAGTSATLFDFLEAEGHVVDSFDFTAAPPTPEEIAANDLIVVARETNSGDYIQGTEPADWNSIALPMISMAPHLMRANRWGWMDGNDIPALDGGAFFAYDEPYLLPDHPIVSGLTTVVLDEFGFAATGVNSPLHPNATLIATAGFDASAGIFIIPQGTPAYSADAADRGIMGGMRIGFIRGNEGSWDFVDPNGEELLRRMITFATAPPGDTDGDGMDDDFELQIANADPDDAISTIEDVLPGDDFDADGLTNKEEHDGAGDRPRTNPTTDDTDGDGASDLAETNDGTFDDLATDTGSNPTLTDTDSDGLPDGVETNDGTLDDPAADTGTSPVDNDSDDDTMPDGYEVANGLDPNTDDAALDLDNDTVPNASEFVTGTDPNNPDTDGDGFSDGVETNDGTFDDIATDTGTDPLDPDTDDDLLDDGAETNSGTFSSATDAGTDPFDQDSDGDGVTDQTEIVYGFDPTNPGEFPTDLNTVLFIGGNGTGDQGADDEAIEFIGRRYGLDAVSYLQASASFAGDEEDFDLLVLSSTPGSGDMRDKFFESTTPILNWEEALADSGFGEFGMSVVQMTKSVTTTQIALGEHPIAAGLPPVVDLFTGGPAETTSTSFLVDGLTAVGTAVDGVVSGGPEPAGDPVDGFPMLFIADAGDPVDFGAGIIGDVAPARRVMFPMTDNTFATFTPDARELFGRSMDWAMGILTVPEEAERILVVDLDQTTSMLTLTWTSDPTPGTAYTVYADSGLDKPVAERTVVAADVPTGGETTTLVLAVSPDTVPDQFYVVAENP